MKTKAEIIEQIETAMRNREISEIMTDDALIEALDYIQSLDNRRAEIAEFENDPETKKLIAESERLGD